MTDGIALYRAICAHPEEDLPRLAFADFLEEVGGQENVFRAEYIRRAIRFARAEPWSQEWMKAYQAWKPFDQKVKRQTADCRLEWVQHLRGRVIAFTWERGFVGHITVHSKRFVAEAEQFLNSDPIQSVRFVKLTAARGTVPVKQLFACPHLARLAKLSLDESELRDADLELIGGCPHLAGLRSISLSGQQRFSPQGLKQLLRSLPAVEELRAAQSVWLTEQFVEALADEPALAKLKVLDWSNHYLSPRGIVTILGSRHTAGLRHLRLSAIGLYDIADADDLPVLRRFQPADGQAIAAALGKCQFPHLQSLDLEGCQIGDAGLEALAAGGFPSLRRLIVSSNNLTLAGLRVLGRSPLGQKLVHLELGFNNALQSQRVMNQVTQMFPNTNVTDNYQL